MIRSAAVLALLAGLSPAAPAARAATNPCDRDVIALPILQQDGAVIVPVTVNGVPAAAAVNPHATPSLVTDAAGLALPHGSDTAIDTLLGRAHGFESTVASLGLGDAVLPGRRAIVLDGPPRPPSRPLVAGRRIAMVIGADILGQFDMLLDLPGRRLLLFPASEPSCPDPAALLPGHPASVPLRDAPGNRAVVVDAVLDGLSLPMEIDLGSNDTIIPRAVARRLGLRGPVLERDPRMVTLAAGHRLGRRHRFNGLVLGPWVIRTPRIDVQPDLSYAALGLDLLGDRPLLFDFPGHRLLLDPAPPSPVPGHASILSDIRTREADTDVEDAPRPRR